jgi:copper chaperone
MKLKIEDMSCGHCVKAITAAVHEQDSNAQLHFELENRLVTIQTTHDAQTLIAAITEAGYTPQPAGN